MGEDVEQKYIEIVYYANAGPTKKMSAVMLYMLHGHVFSFRQ